MNEWRLGVAYSHTQFHFQYIVANLNNELKMGQEAQMCQITTFEFNKDDYPYGKSGDYCFRKINIPGTHVGSAPLQFPSFWQVLGEVPSSLNPESQL